MGARGVRIWDWLIAVLGFLLILSLFLKWFKSNGDPQTGWQSLAFIDKTTLIAGLIGMAMPLIAFRRQTPADAQRYVMIVIAAGVIAGLLILYRIASPPALNTSHFKTTVMAGAWVALVLAFAMAAAAFLTARSRVASRAASV